MTGTKSFASGYFDSIKNMACSLFHVPEHLATVHPLVIRRFGRFGDVREVLAGQLSVQ